jgi:DNA-binding response OmpR family regulator
MVGCTDSPQREANFMPGYVGERRILVVEDERMVADSLGQILRAHGYSVRIAYSAEAAIDLLDWWRPELAILDVMLPQMNGIELAMTLKESFPDCGILLFSGQPSVEALVEQARRDGHQFDILPKPVHPSVMLKAISTMLAPDWGPFRAA